MFKKAKLKKWKKNKERFFLILVHKKRVTKNKLIIKPENEFR